MRTYIVIKDFPLGDSGKTGFDPLRRKFKSTQQVRPPPLLFFRPTMATVQERRGFPPTEVAVYYIALFILFFFVFFFWRSYFVSPLQRRSHGRGGEFGVYTRMRVDVIMRAGT